MRDSQLCNPIEMINTTNFTTRMKTTWAVGDEIVMDVSGKVPTFPVCCIHIGKKEVGVLMCNSYAEVFFNTYLDLTGLFSKD